METVAYVEFAGMLNPGFQWTTQPPAGQPDPALLPAAGALSGAAPLVPRYVTPGGRVTSSGCVTVTFASLDPVFLIASVSVVVLGLSVPFVTAAPLKNNASRNIRTYGPVAFDEYGSVVEKLCPPM